RPLAYNFGNAIVAFINPLVWTIGYSFYNPNIKAVDLVIKVAPKASFTSAVVAGLEMGYNGIRYIQWLRHLAAVAKMRAKAAAAAAKVMEQDVEAAIAAQLEGPKEVIFPRRPEYRVPGAIVAAPKEQVSYEQDDYYRTDKIWPCERCHKRHRPRTETEPDPCQSYVDEIADHRAKQLFNTKFEQFNRQRKRSNGDLEKQQQRKKSQMARDKIGENSVVDEVKIMNRHMEDQNRRLKISIEDNKRYINENNEFIRRYT
ncbi:MAG: hypothetical protein LE168_02485, partial [Endomicrobium sp.]|nr:hypothetical protein [Endomicrobium sp.]